MSRSENKSSHAFILTEDESVPTIEQLQTYLGKTLPDVFEFSDETLSEDGSLTFSIGEYFVYVSSIGSAYPADELEYFCDRAWWWPEAEQGIANAKNHLLVAVLGGEDRVTRSIILTYLTAAALDSISALAVVWGAAATIRSCEDFLEECERARRGDTPLPLLLWLELQVYQADDGTSIFYSTGMQAFGHREVEVHKSTLAPGALIDSIFPLLLYIVTEDIEFNDGDTFGMSEEEKYSLRYGPSISDPEQKVLLVALP